VHGGRLDNAFPNPRSEAVAGLAETAFPIHDFHSELARRAVIPYTQSVAAPLGGILRFAYEGNVAQLLIQRGTEEHVLDLREDHITTIGRSRDADVYLDELSLSRRHCEIRHNRGQWILKDLGSFNGTFCNNLAVTECRLKPGDVIQLSQWTLEFQQTREEILAASRQSVHGDMMDQSVAITRKLRNFMWLLEISKAVNSVLSKDLLLSMIIDKAIELTAGERGFLILQEGKDTVFKVARNRSAETIGNPETQVSRSVVAQVVQSGAPVQSIDAQTDLKDLSATIASLDIRSLLCAPLKVKDRVLGCIYVDSLATDMEFADDTLDMLQAFADQAAIALENARLYDEVMASREQEKRVRQMFQKYVPADVVRQALAIPDGARMSSKQVATVLFSDIRSFTSISERLEPEEVVTFLNDYLQRMVDIVFDEGGIVDKFIGDAVMAIFGAPFPKPDDALRAVRCAHRMIAGLEQFNQSQSEKGGVQIRIGIGVHTGPLIAGNIGSDRKMEYTVIGDTVNIASRVQDLNKEFKTEIIITQGCYEATRRRVPVRPLPPVMVKGKELPLQVYEALRPKPAAQPVGTSQQTTNAAIPVMRDDPPPVRKPQ